MSKKIKANIMLQIPGGAATPGQKIGSSLGQHGLNIMDFCKKFNAVTTARKGETVPVVITVYTDKTYDFIVKTSPVSELLKKRANVSKGASNPSKEQVGTVKMKDVEEIAKIKMPDLNAFDLEAAKRMVIGSARSMGLVVVD